MLWSAESKVPGNGPSASATYRHVSSTFPSTYLFCLRDRSHSLQTRWSSRLATSSGKETHRGASLARLRPCIGILMLSSGDWHKWAKDNPSRLTQRLSTLSHRGIG
jgi:hypothetical protein